MDGPARDLAIRGSPQNGQSARFAVALAGCDDRSCRCADVLGQAYIRRSIGSCPVAQHPSRAIAQPAGPQTALRADPGRTTAPPPTTPRRPGPPGAVAVGRPVAGRPAAGSLGGCVEAGPSRTRPLSGERSSTSPARPRSRRGNTRSVATSSSATPGTTGRVPRGNCVTCWCPSAQRSGSARGTSASVSRCSARSTGGWRPPGSASCW